MANPRLTDAQVRNQREQALRALRRLERSLDSQLEVIERQMDRAIENKEKITIRLMDGIVDNWKKFILRALEMQKGVADAVQIFMDGK